MIFLKKIFYWYQKLNLIFIVLALFLGVISAKFIPIVTEYGNNLVGGLIDAIVLFAPLAIFLVLAPNVTNMLVTRKESKFGGIIIAWFTGTRILAGIWAAIFTSLILGLSFFPESQMAGIKETIFQNLKMLGGLMLHNPFFWAIWVAIIAGVIGYYFRKIQYILDKGVKGIEAMGDRIEAFIPVLMFLLGAYLYSLPTELKESFEPGVLASIKQIGEFKLLFFNIDITSEFGLLWVYLIGSVLIGVGCFIWQGAQLLIVKKFIKGFSIKEFFKRYWIKIYPLAWSTSSEMISMPLNMSLIKRTYQDIDGMVRRLVIGLGAYLNINGTTMHVILLAGIVATMIGYPPSFLELLIAVPIIALIGFGVPGVPGELVLFAIPMMKILNIPEELIPMFLGLYLALQIGLPDSFRTGANVTDNGFYALILNRLYKNKYKDDKKVAKQPNNNE